MSPQGFLFSIILVHFQTAGTNGRLTVDSVIATKKKKAHGEKIRGRNQVSLSFFGEGCYICAPLKRWTVESMTH